MARLASYRLPKIMYNKLNKKNEKGFTLIEIMVAVSIFVMVAMITTGTLVIIANANRKMEEIKQGIDNVSFALNSMAIRIREGRWLWSGEPVRPVSVDNLSCQDHFDVFLDFDDKEIEYKIYSENGHNCVARVTGGNSGSSLSCLTASNVEIDFLRFCPLLEERANNGDYFKIPVVISVGGRVVGRSGQSNFYLQTTVLMRNIL